MQALPALRRAVYCCSLMALIFALLLPAEGQSTAGRLLGRVSDTTGQE
jgi:hypothetical protein